MSGRSFLRRNLKACFSMCHHAFCNLASDWLLRASLDRDSRPFFYVVINTDCEGALALFEIFAGHISCNKRSSMRYLLLL